MAIYPGVPLCQSSRVQANWHSRCSIADRPICSDRYPSQEAFIPCGKGGEKWSFCKRCSLNQHPADWLCLLLALAGDMCLRVQRKRWFARLRKSAARNKTYLCKHCNICRLVRSVHWRYSWVPDSFLWLSPSGRSGGTQKTFQFQHWGQTGVGLYVKWDEKNNNMRKYGSQSDLIQDSKQQSSSHRPTSSNLNLGLHAKCEKTIFMKWELADIL